MERDNFFIPNLEMKIPQFFFKNPKLTKNKLHPLWVLNPPYICCEDWGPKTNPCFGGIKSLYCDIQILILVVNRVYFNILVLKRLNVYTSVLERFSFNALVFKRLNTYTLIPEWFFNTLILKKVNIYTLYILISSIFYYKI